MIYQRHLPNIITLFRIAVVPFIILALKWDSQWAGVVAALIFITASISDYYDGYFARKYKIESVMGTLLDPIADKILVSSTLIMLIPSGRLDPIMVIILLARDTFINGLRSVAASENIVIPAGSVGKWKTGFQMVGIPCVLIYKIPFKYLDILPVYQIGYWIMWLSVILSVYSGFVYIQKYIKKNPRALD